MTRVGRGSQRRVDGEAHREPHGEHRGACEHQPGRDGRDSPRPPAPVQQCEAGRAGGEQDEPEPERHRVEPRCGVADRVELLQDSPFGTGAVRELADRVEPPALREPTT